MYANLSRHLGGYGTQERTQKVQEGKPSPSCLQGAPCIANILANLAKPRGAGC